MPRVIRMLLVLGVLGLFLPVAAYADAPGTSAGDQQYIDPLAGGGGHATAKHSPKATAPAAPAPAATPAPKPIAPPPTLAPPPAPASPAPAPVSAPVTYEASASTTAAATPAPISSGSTGTASTSSDPAELARTGYDGLLAAAVGLLLFGAGALLRRADRAW
jgi:hypothetical protein